MKILIACEYSGIVREAFKANGHDAWSCDFLDSEIPGQHFKGNVLLILNDRWDMIIGFPPCTHLAVSGARWFKEKQKDGRQQQSIEFFMRLINAPCDKIAIENPISIMSTYYRKPDQIIQPFWFGDPYKKTTCLWLKNLPKLNATNVINPKIITYKDGSKFSSDYGWSTNKNRSKTYQGIANAMANQWG
jgi:site-specific DNA-cytosine methylase